MYGNRGQQVKGAVDRPGTELFSYCSQPEAINRFCGILPEGHDEGHCHQMSEKRKEVLQRMKEVIKKLDKMDACDQWDTWPTFNNTPGPHRFGFHQPRGKPWDLNRVKSRELIGSKMRIDECLRKNGLQDDCQRLQCRGRAWCLEEPFPLCPPFTGVQRQPCDPDPYSVCPHRPWEDHPGYRRPPPCVEDPVAKSIGRDRTKCSPSCCADSEDKENCWKLRCPTTGESHNFRIVPVRADELPEALSAQGPVFKLSHATCHPKGVCPPK